MKTGSEIGEQLQEARQERGLSLEDVAHKTRIPLTTLKSLEKNDHSGFASPAYAKSFLYQYSEFLKIDAHEILESFNTGNVLDKDDRIEFINEGKSSSKQRAASIRGSSASSSSKSSSSKISQSALILIITACLIAVSIWGFITVEKRLNADPEETADTALEPEIEPTTSPPPSKKPVTSASSTTTPQEANRPARIISTGKPDAIASTPPPNKPTDDEGPVYVFPEDTPAPRAIIVNEDEDE